MKIARQIAWQVMQISWISVALMYAWSFAADLVTEKEDAANVAGFAIYITIFAALIIVGTHYVRNFQKIFAKEETNTKETPNAGAEPRPDNP
jgi:phosphotransferase system  glucose/maltose/N-acetylglucosamine-specific IIC component